MGWLVDPAARRWRWRWLTLVVKVVAVVLGVTIREIKDVVDQGGRVGGGDHILVVTLRAALDAVPNGR